ncbi:MAG: retroviral-like aspartic protease family protein [Trichodesmium sp. MAG_R04]|nr:retroviral-like aspartic protease family protein [Trichodesmium sp. MAG_R04]
MMMENFSIYKASDKNYIQYKQQVKNIFWQIPAILLTTLVCTGVIAQEYPGCFMVDELGNKKDLTISVCGLFEEELPEEVSTSSPTAGIYQIPIKGRLGGTPVVDVTFNGNKTYEMLLDTGATRTFITQEMADSLKIIPSGQGIVTVADGRDIELKRGIVGSISAGDLEFKQFIIGILPPLAKSPLLGQDFFGNYDMTVKEKLVELRIRSSS